MILTLMSGHPKCKAFVTHGGMFGTQEASYHGVPMVGFPMGADQHLNLAKSTMDGVAVELDWHNYTADSLAKTINLVISDPS
jgi:glucuronosyltransferase